MKWILTPDEFAIVWTRETDLARRPYPLDTSPAVSENPAGASRFGPLPLGGASSRNLRRTDPDLASALALCARTDTTTVTLYGERTARPGARRILAFAAGGSAAGRDPGLLAGAVTVSLCPADHLGRELVEIIGSAPPGRLAALREPQQAVLYPDASGAGEEADRFRRKLREPVDGRGFITVTVEPANPLSPPTRHRTWMDFSGDGRYLLTTAADLTLAPVTDEELAAQLVRLARV
ncbi:ESX secretion-associated protein EspG [Nocardia tengchongensis]|uniref:ESX secretion-associated protein EspG n=1 Tax=Nocardia tengchongensis TaxID=2055889 RepID=A0ABX8CU06_9NOCA|nr:ESX secretion-associated protein EspG [Nocardia tengchongensis]QVI23024.1 ESX secretion-associated protein EspG [Nocardia tengchongensis]